MTGSDAEERIVHESPGIRLGVFRCGPSDWRWREVNDIGDVAHVVFGQTSVVIQQEGDRERLCTPNNLIVYSPGQRYRRRLHDPAGDRSVFLALAPALTAELGGLRAGVAPCDARSHAAVLLAARLAASPSADAALAVEETLAAVLERARAAAGRGGDETGARGHAELVEHTKLALCDDLQSRLFFPSVAADIGAHVGNHTIFLAGVLGLTTYAFEPNPTNFSLLRSNLAANALQDRCLVHNVALGARRSQGTIERVSNANSGMSRVRAAPGGSVEILSLDSAFARLARLDVLKVDVEGGEIDVLRGAADTFRRLRPVAYLEVTPENFGQASELLSSYGYLCWKRFNATATFLFLPKERLGR